MKRRAGDTSEPCEKWTRVTGTWKSPEKEAGSGERRHFECWAMTGRGRELTDVMERRNLVGVLCVHETRGKWNTTKRLGGGCKLLRSGANEQGRYGVEIVLSK